VLDREQIGVKSQRLALPPATLADLAAGLFLMMLAVTAAALLDVLYEPYRDARVHGSQTHYQLDDAVLYWAEFGRAADLNVKTAATSVSVELDGIHPAQPWMEREVFWSARTVDEGTIDIRFPPALSVQAVRLFVVDGDSFMRVSLLQSGDQVRFANSHHDGVWLDFPVTVGERKAGRKSILLKKLVGDDARISALVLTGPGGDT